jgi:hypothetical protein
MGADLYIYAASSQRSLLVGIGSMSLVAGGAAWQAAVGELIRGRRKIPLEDGLQHDLGHLLGHRPQIVGIPQCSPVAL